MKLHLPTGLRAALIAAITAVGFTLPQTYAAGTPLNITQPGSSQLESSNSPFNWREETGDLSSWQITFDMLTGSDKNNDIFNLNAASSAGTGYHLSVVNSTDMVLRDNSGNALITLSGVVKVDERTPITLSFVKDVDDTGSSLGTGTFSLSSGDTEAITKQVAAGTGNEETTFKKNNSLTRIWTNGGAQKIYAITLTKLEDHVIASVAYEWNAKDSGTCTWDTTSKIWLKDGQDVAYVASSDAKFTSTAAYNQVTIDSAITAANVSVSANYIFNTSATLTATKLTIASGSTLTVNGTGSVSTGELINKGTLSIGTGASVAASTAIEVATGDTFTVTGEGTLDVVTLRSKGGSISISSNLNVTGGSDGQGGNNQNGLCINGGTGGSISILGGVTTVTGAVYTGGGSQQTAINVGTGVTDATLVTTRLELGDTNGSTCAFTIGEHGKVVILSDVDARADVANPQKKTGLQLAEWNQVVTSNISGRLYAQNATAFMSNDASSTINVNGGTMAVKGIATTNATSTRAHTFTVTDGSLILGDRGIAAEPGEWNITFTDAEIGTYADSTVVGRNFTIANNVTFNTAMYTWTGEGAELILEEGTNAGAITVSGNITGDGTITKKGAGTLSFNGDANELNNTINVQSGTLELNGTFSIDGNTSGLTTSYSGADHANNGFKTSSGTVTVYTKEAGATVTVGGDAVFLYGPNNPVELDENGKCQISAQTDYTTFYVNEAEESVSTAKKRAEMQDIVLAENTTLNVDEDFNGEHIDIVSGTATVNIASDKTLTAIADGATITGAGTYVLESSSVVGGKVTMSDTLGEGWTGTVQIHDVTTSATTQNDFTSLVKDGSTIELKGFSGLTNKWLSDQTENIKLTNSEGRGYAWYYSGATSGTGLSTFSGSWSGDGTLQTAGNKLQYKFIGDISAWNGMFQVASGTPTLTFAGNSSAVNAAIDRNGNTLNMVVDTTADATFYNTVDVSSLSVAAGKKATFQANSTVGQLNGAGTVGVTGTDTILTITGAAGASSTAAVAVDAGATLELAVGNALGSTQTVTNSGNVLIHKTLTSGTINGGTLTLASDFPVDGGGLQDVGGTSTGNGFTRGGELHVFAAPAVLTDCSIVYGGTSHDLSELTNGTLSLGDVWSIYQLNVDAQYTVQEIMDYAKANEGELKTISVNADMLTIENDSATLKTSMLGGEHLATFAVYMSGVSGLTIDGDCGAAITTNTGAEGAVTLTKDATVGSIVAGDFENGGAGNLTINGEGHTVKADGAGAAFGGVLALGKGVTLELLHDTSFTTMQNATVKLGESASLVLNEVSFSTVEGGTEATIKVTSDEYLPLYDPSFAEYGITGARITYTTSANFDLGHVIDATSQVVNKGTGSLRDISTNEKYAELNAEGGDIFISTAEDAGTDERALIVGDLTLSEGRTVAEDTGKAVTITVNGTASFGSGARVSSALTMAGGSKLDADGPIALDSHALTLAQGVNIGEDLWSTISTLASETSTTIFTGVSALTLAGAEYDKTKKYDLTSIFSHETDIKSGKYSLSYDGSNVIVSRNADNGRYWKGGSETWNYSNTHWTDEGGDDAQFASGYDAHFDATPGGTVTLGENITAASISVTGADYIFAPGDPAHTLTVTDSVEVSGDHTATFNMGLSGADTLKLVAKDKGKLVLNENSSVKTVEIGADSTVTAGKTLAVEGNVVNNGTLETNATTSITGDLTLGNESIVTGTGTVNATSVTLTGNTTVSGSLSTDSLSGTSTLRLTDGKLTTGSLGSVQLAASGNSTITASGSSALVLNGPVDNSAGTLTFVGQFDVSNLTATPGTSTYVEGETKGNGFEQAHQTVTVITGGTASGEAATFIYKNTSAEGTISSTGTLSFNGVTDYTKFYVNTGSEKVSTALKHDPTPALVSIELANGTTLEADRNIDVSKVNVATDKSATLKIDDGITVTTDGATKAGLTLKGAGTLAVDSGKTTTGVTLNATEWTGTVSFTNAELATLDGAYTNNSTVSLTGVTGSMGATPITGKVVLNEGTDDWGFGQTVNGTITLNGDITGEGNLGVKGDTVNSTIILGGDINGWNGNFVANNANATLKLTGDDKTVNGTVTGSNLALVVETNATLKSDSTVARVNATAGSLKVEADKRLTVTDTILPNNIKLGAGASIAAAFMGGTEYGYMDGTIANETGGDQAVSIDNADITVTGATLCTNGGTGFTVNNKLVDAKLLVAETLTKAVVLNNVQDSLEVVDGLAIGAGGSLKVANGGAKQTLNISSGTLTLANGATMDANLAIGTGVTLAFNYDQASPVAATLSGGSLDLAKSLTLSGDLYSQMAAFTDADDEKVVVLFQNVGALTLGGAAYEGEVSAQQYFTNLTDLSDLGDFTLLYNDSTDTVSIRFDVSSAKTLTWNGTAGEHDWLPGDDTMLNWETTAQQPAYFEQGDNAKFTKAEAYQEVTIAEGRTETRNLTISGEDAQYAFVVGNGTSTIASSNLMKVTEGASLSKRGAGDLVLELNAALAVENSTLAVEEGSLYIGGASRELNLKNSALDIADSASLIAGTIKGDADSTIIMGRESLLSTDGGSIQSLQAGEDSTLAITGGTLTIAEDTIVYNLVSTGTLDLGTKDLTLAESTTDGGNVTAGTLNLAEDGSTFGNLKVNTIHYAYDKEGAGTLDYVAVDTIVSNGADKITLDLTDVRGDGGSLAPIQRLDEGTTYTLVYAGSQALNADDFTLDAATQEALVQNGLIQAGAGLEVNEDNDGILQLTIGGQNLTWYTDKDVTEWGYQVVSGDALTAGGDTLNGVEHVVVDASRKIDVTGAGSEPGLRVRNITGLDGRTITFSGTEDDTVNLITNEETASNVNVAAENIRVNVGLHELDEMDPSDYESLHLGGMSLTGSYLDVAPEADLTVGALNGDSGSLLNGELTVDNAGGSYRGSYDNAHVILESTANQALAAKQGLTVSGTGVATLTYSGKDAVMEAIHGHDGVIVVLNDPDTDNSGNTLTLNEASEITDGFAIIGMSAVASARTLDTEAAPVLLAAPSLDMSGSTLIINQTDESSTIAMAVNDGGYKSNLYLAGFGAEDTNADDVQLIGYLYNKYYTNARMQSGRVLVDRNRSFYTDITAPTTENGRAGAGMLDDALLYTNPQVTNPDGDLATVMTALETGGYTHNRADKVMAAMSGASQAAMGAAWNRDVDRQLRAIRNRTTQMGLAECTHHEGLPYFNAWINAEGDYTKLSGDGTLAGYKLSSWGGTVGVDVDCTARFTVGAAVTAMSGDFTAESMDQAEGDLNRLYVSVFGRYARRAWTHTLVATFGMADTKLKRTVNYDYGSYNTESSSDGTAFGVMYEVGYVTALNEDASTCLQPVLNLSYRHSSLGGATEQSASDAALRLGDVDANVFTAAIGARLQSAVGTSVYNRSSIFEGRVMLKFDAGDRDTTAGNGFIGMPGSRSTKSTEAGMFGVEVGAGLTIPLSENAGALFFDVTGDFRAKDTEINGTVGYRYNF